MIFTIPTRTLRFCSVFRQKTVRDQNRETSLETYSSSNFKTYQISLYLPKMLITAGEFVDRTTCESTTLWMFSLHELLGAIAK